MKRILVVDDEFDFRGVMELLLQFRGYSVSTAQNGEVALKKIAEGRPQIILTDWMMPVMDGYEFCRRVRTDPATRNIPIIVVTAAEAALNSKEKLWDALLPKPVDFDHLLALIDDLTSQG